MKIVRFGTVRKSDLPQPPKGYRYHYRRDPARRIYTYRVAFNDSPPGRPKLDDRFS